MKSKKSLNRGTEIWLTAFENTAWVEVMPLPSLGNAVDW